jgi:hypothetical protein
MDSEICEQLAPRERFMVTKVQHIAVKFTHISRKLFRVCQETYGPYQLIKASSQLITFLDDLMTVHRSITLVDLQLDAQNSYLFTYNTLIKILYMFRALPCSSSGGLGRNCIYAASGIVTLCR